MIRIGRDAVELHRLDERALGDVERGGPQHARDLRRVREADGEHDQPELRAGDADQQQREDELRKREDHVDDAHDRRVGPAARGRRPRRLRRRRGPTPTSGRGGRHQEQHPAAVEHPAQGVASQRVAAEQQVAGRRRVRDSADERRRRMRRDERPDHGDEHDEAREHEADRPRRVRAARAMTTAEFQLDDRREPARDERRPRSAVISGTAAAASRAAPRRPRGC